MTPSSPSPSPAPSTEAPPVLSVSIIDLAGSYDPATRRLGALNCNFVFPDDPNDRWCFNAFGSSAVPGKQVPSFDYKVAAGATVSAATAGTVMRVDRETNALYPDEFEIETRASRDSSYLIIYDHVKNLRVGTGSVVEAGTVLGTAGIHTSNPNVFGRIELQINRVTERTPIQKSVPICARTLGTERFNQLNDAALAAHNSANPASAAASVCVADTVQP